jgi:predicted TIM-barrel fold metal-dependent hydrolase
MQKGNSMIVDTHAHIYHADETLYPKRENPLRPPAGSGGIEDLRQQTTAAGVERVVLVQTGSAYQWDNRVVGATAAAEADWVVGVCNLDPAAADSPAALERLVLESNIKGIRMEPTKEAEPRYFHPGAVALWTKAQELGVVVCAHINTGHHDALALLLEQFPQVPVVLDHCAYPKTDAADRTLDELEALAHFPQLYGKLSFGVTASEQEYPFGDTHSMLRRVIDTLGPERCMWGSGFPCDLWLKKSTYEQHLRVFTEALGLTLGEQEAILQTAPMRVWFDG